MADLYIEALRSIQPHGPYRVGGWSFGGFVAFEIARRLFARGEEVQLVALLDTVPPPRNDPPEDDEALFTAFARFLVEGAGVDFEALNGELSRLAPDERLAFLVERGEQAGLLPPDT